MSIFIFTLEVILVLNRIFKKVEKLENHLKEILKKKKKLIAKLRKVFLEQKERELEY